VGRLAAATDNYSADDAEGIARGFTNCSTVNHVGNANGKVRSDDNGAAMLDGSVLR
jgi:hypothetical protein